MIIKSHIRGGYRSAANYMKEQGKNEKTRLVEISDPSAKNLDDAFHNMWVVASNTRCKKPLHHISINPMPGERLTDEQVLKIVERCEEKYGYKMFHHQRVIVEHIKDGRQHFHVIWNRVSLCTGRPVWPGLHWKLSKEVCREMEKELGLMRPSSRQTKRNTNKSPKPRSGRNHRHGSSKPALKKPAHINVRTHVIGGRAYEHLNSPVTHHSWNGAEFYHVPFRPVVDRKGWPLLAVIHWDTWGKRNLRRFFALWPELSK